jgi:hypothetical protein
MYGLVLVSIYATENEAIAFGHPDQPVAYQKRGGEPTDITDEEQRKSCFAGNERISTLIALTLGLVWR